MTGDGGSDHVDVELDIYSGRANPTWSLTGPAAAGFLERLAGLRPTAPFRATNDLGYRGFVVRWNQGGSSCAAVVQGGRVAVTCGQDTTYHADARRALERWLLGTGRRVLDPATLASVEPALGDP